MAVADSRLIDLILRTTNPAELMETLGPAINDFIEGAAKPKALATQLLAKILAGVSKTELKRMDKAAARELVQTRLEATLQTDQAKAAAKLGEIGTRGEQTKSLIGVRTDERLRLEEGRQLQKEAAAVRTADLEIETTRSKLLREAEAAERKLSANLDRVRTQPKTSMIDLIEKQAAIDLRAKVAAPGGAYTEMANLLEDADQEVRASAQTQTKRDLLRQAHDVNVRIPRGILDLVEADVVKTGRPLSPTDRAKYIDLAAVETEMGSVGLKPVYSIAEEGGVRTMTGVTGGPLKGVPLVERGGASGAVNLIKEAEALAGSGERGLIKKLVSRAGSALSKGQLGRLGVGAGILSLLLLPSLMKGEQQKRELPPLMQAQLLQMLAKMQQGQMGTESLVQSRQAAGEKNMAQAALYRMQAMNEARPAVPLLV